MIKNRKSNGVKKRDDVKRKLIKRQADEIASLKSQIDRLDIDNKNKDELLHSVDSLREELEQVIESIRSKEAEYDELISDLRLMRKAFDREVFKNRWWIVKRLIKA